MTGNFENAIKDILHVPYSSFYEERGDTRYTINFGEF